MRLFVTGVNGFIGSHFVAHAAAAKHEVVGLGRSKSSGASGTKPAGVTMRYGDLLDPESLRSALTAADCVCHFAAAFKEAGAGEDYFQRVNVEGTASLMAAAHAAGVKRFVLCSTAGIYGRRVAEVIDESHSAEPWNAYERSKLAAEETVRREAAANGMQYVILRPSAVYGPRDRRLAKLFRNASRGRFPLFGRGDGRRHMIYVSDLANAFLRACTRPEAANQEMIVAGPDAVPLRELLDTLAQLAHRRSSGPQLPLKPVLRLAAVTEDVCRWLKIDPPLHRRRMDFYTNDAVYDCTRASAVLGWKPEVSLREGLAATLRSQQASHLGAAQRHGILSLAKIVALQEALHGFGVGLWAL